jgi:sugar (pentulose or hexulose) kinase
VIFTPLFHNYLFIDIGRICPFARADPSAFDPNMWWQNVIDTIHKVLNQSWVAPGEVPAGGVCRKMHTAVPLSRDGELLSNAVKLCALTSASRPWGDHFKRVLLDLFRGPSK